MNEAQKFLLNKGYNDLVITHPIIVDPKKWVYVSDAIMEFQRHLSDQSSGQNKCSAESHALKRMGGYSVCPDCDEDISGNSNICGTCDGSGQIPCPDGFAICRECWGG